MLERIFPKQFDNTYRGYTIAIWLLVLLVLFKLLMGGGSMFNTRNVMEGADGIPLSTYGAGAAQTIMFMFRTWGLNLALLSLLGLIAIVRYRSMVPLVYLLLTIENVGRKAMTLFDPVPTVSSGDGGMPLGFLINLGLIGALLIGFALSLGPSDAKK